MSDTRILVFSREGTPGRLGCLRPWLLAISVPFLLFGSLSCTRSKPHKGSATGSPSSSTPAVGGAYPPPPPVSPSQSVPPGATRTRSIIIGTVTGRAGTTLLVQAESPPMIQRVEPAAGIAIHTGGTWDDIQVGDHIDGFGETDANGVIVLQSIDVNVVQVWGTIASVTSDAWLVTPEERHTNASIPRDSEGRVRVTFDPAHPLQDRKGPITLQRLLEAKPGTVIEVVGVRAPSASAVTAETLIGTGPPDALGP